MKLAGRSWPPPREASAGPATSVLTSEDPQIGMDVERSGPTDSPLEAPELVLASQPLDDVPISSDPYKADAQGEGPSTSTPVIDSPQDENPSLPPDNRPGLAAQRLPHLRPPNPFALQRSHSSFALLAKKIKQEPPESTHDMLARITWLSSQAVRASEEKLGIATAAYNSVRPKMTSPLSVTSDHNLLS